MHHSLQIQALSAEDWLQAHSVIIYSVKNRQSEKEPLSDHLLLFWRAWPQDPVSSTDPFAHHYLQVEHWNSLLETDHWHSSVSVLLGVQSSELPLIKAPAVLYTSSYCVYFSLVCLQDFMWGCWGARVVLVTASPLAWLAMRPKKDVVQGLFFFFFNYNQSQNKLFLTVISFWFVAELLLVSN